MECTLACIVKKTKYQRKPQTTLTKRLLYNPYSQSAERTKVHFYLPYGGAISFYVYIVPLSISLYVWTRSDFLWAPANTFLFKFPYKTFIVKKGEISYSFLAKTTCVIGKVIKNYIMARNDGHH